MSNFKSKFGKTLRIETGFDGHVKVKIDGNGGLFDPADAPAIALAVLEAAGHKRVPFPMAGLDAAVDILVRHIRDTAAEAAAAAEEAELEAEALELRLQFVGQSSADPTVYKDDWLRVARRARELAAERNAR